MITFRYLFAFLFMVAIAVFSAGESLAGIKCQPKDVETALFSLRPNGVQAKDLSISWRGASHLRCTGDQLDKLVQGQYIEFKVPAADLVDSGNNNNSQIELEVRIIGNLEKYSNFKQFLKIGFQPILNDRSSLPTNIEFDLFFEDMDEPTQDDIRRVQKIHDIDGRIYRPFFMGMQMAQSNNFNVRLAGLFFQAISAQDIGRRNRNKIGVEPNVIIEMNTTLDKIHEKSDKGLVRAFEFRKRMYGSLSQMYYRLGLKMP